MIVAGLGFCTGVTAPDFLRLIRRAEVDSGLTVQALATPEFKSGSTALQETAALLGLPLLLIDRPALREAQPRCRTMSKFAASATGLSSIAEACALAAAGPSSVLLLPRITAANATCALAGTLP